MGSHLNFKNFGHTLTGDNSTMKPPENFPLVRQPSIYSLTFDEFQNTWGGELRKDFGSMNMDELLKNIWTAEETQAVTSTVAAGDGGGVLGGNLQRQGSLTLPRTLSQKTVDQVWRDLTKESSGGVKDGGGVGSNFPQRQPTLGEMTLEEFLVRAGVVREDPQQFGRPNNGGFFGELSQLSNYNNTGPALGFQQPNDNNGFVGAQIMEKNSNLVANQSPSLALNVGEIRSSQQLPQQQLQPPQPQPQPQQHPLLPKPANVAFASPMHLSHGTQVAGAGVRGSVAGVADLSMNNNLVSGGGMGMVGLGTGSVTVGTGSPARHISSDVIAKSNTDTSSLSPVPYVFSRGRKAGAALEKVVERRQRRMIKNRESAARSRARKQAYTMELEAEVAKLKEMNKELQRKQEEIVEMQKNQLLEKINQQWGGKRQCLRRTLTGPW